MKRVLSGRGVLAAVALLLAASLAGLVLVRRAAHTDTRRDAERRASERAEIAAALIDSTFKSVTGTESSANRLAGALSQDLLRDIAAESGGNGLTVVESHGRVIATYPKGDPPLGSDLSGEEHVRAALDGGEAVVSGVKHGRRSQVVEIAVPVEAREGTRVMLLPYSVDLIGGFLGGYLDRVGHLEGSGAYLVDRAGKVIAARHGAGVGRPLADPELAAALGRADQGTYSTGGDERYFVSRVVTVSGWKVVFEAPTASLYGEAPGIPGWIVWLLFGAFACAAVGSLLLLSRLASRSRALARANAELEASNREIRSATEAKTRFLASMSHELRTPLNGIIGFAELMHDGRVGELAPQHREYMGDILSSGRHLLTLINDVLDMAKVESGEIQFRPERVDLGRLIGEALDSQRPVAANARISLYSEIDVSATPAVLDPARFKQVLLNYLSNALEFTPAGGEVTVRLAREDDAHVRLEVVDSGPGIDPPDQRDLFVEFRQLGSDGGKAGTGLGLALTKRIVEGQGGRVGVESRRGAGSRFFAVIPSLQFPGLAGIEVPDSALEARP